MNDYKRMKVLILSLSTFVFSTTLLPCAPNDSTIARNNIRTGSDSRTGVWLDRSSLSGRPFSSVVGTSPASGLQSNQRNSFQASDNIQTQDAAVPSSPSYVRPALFVGGALATTAILIRTDQSTYNALHRWRMVNDPIEDVSPVITNLGDGRASMAIFGGFLAYSFIGKDKSAFEAGRIGLESFLVSGIATQILKHTFGRERPSAATQSGGRWNGVFFLLNQGSGKHGGYAQFDAFPSGHTATVFAAATTFSEVFHDSPWVSYASYTVATSVAISRVMERTHWLSDCFVGGLIGYFSTKLVLHYNHSDKPIALLPTYNGESMGLALHVGL